MHAAFSVFRVHSIDFLRGLVMLVMTVDHAREFFFVNYPLTDPMQLGAIEPALFFSRWMTHFCAPVFVLLTGVSAYLYGQKEGRGKKDVSLYLLKRGALLILFEATIINFAWTFQFPPKMFYFQIFWAIGFSMICLSGLLWLRVSHILLVGLMIIFGHNLFDAVHADTHTFWGVLWAFLHERSVLEITSAHSLRTSYPALPWVGVIAVGYALGSLYKNSFDPKRRQVILNAIGLGACACFFVLRISQMYGDASLLDPEGQGAAWWMSLLNVTKYPPSLHFLLMTLGPACLLLSLAEKWQGAGVRMIATFGRVPFFYYIAHLYFLHLAYLVFSFSKNSRSKAAYSFEHLSSVWLMALLTLAALYPLVRMVAKLKREKPWPILSYL